MAIHYALYRNEKIAGKDRYIARVRSHGTLSREDVIRRARHCGTTLTDSDLNAAWELFETIAINALAEGWNVTMPCCILSSSVRGTFKDYKERFDPKRHKLEINCRASSHIQKEVKFRAQIKRIDPQQLRPLLLSYLDVCTGQRDRVLSPGRMGRLYGDRLKFDPQDPRQGIFILGADARITRVEEVAQNTPHTLIFLIPPLSIGPYKLAVRASYSGSPNLDVGFLDDVLYVAPPELLLEAPSRDFASQAMSLLGMGRDPYAEDDPDAATETDADSLEN